MDSPAESVFEVVTDAVPAPQDGIPAAAETAAIDTADSSQHALQHSQPGVTAEEMPAWSVDVEAADLTTEDMPDQMVLQFAIELARAEHRYLQDRYLQALREEMESKSKLKQLLEKHQEAKAKLEASRLEVYRCFALAAAFVTRNGSDPRMEPVRPLAEPDSDESGHE